MRLKIDKRTFDKIAAGLTDAMLVYGRRTDPRPCSFEMSLLDELKSKRDYWLVPVSPTGNSNHPDLQIIKVLKGANDPEVEISCELMEQEMLKALW